MCAQETINKAGISWTIAGPAGPVRSVGTGGGKEKKRGGWQEWVREGGREGKRRKKEIKGGSRSEGL